MLAAALTGCAGQETGEVTVETTLQLCREDRCRDLPAAGAQVTFFAGGDPVGTAVLDEGGRVTRTLGTGTYTVDVSMPELGLRITQDETTPTELDERGGVTFALAFPGPVDVDTTPRLLRADGT